MPFGGDFGRLGGVGVRTGNRVGPTGVLCRLRVRISNECQNLQLRDKGEAGSSVFDHGRFLESLETLKQEQKDGQHLKSARKPLSDNLGKTTTSFIFL